MQERKRLEEAIANDAFIRSMTSDLETLLRAVAARASPSPPRSSAR